MFRAAILNCSVPCLAAAEDTQRECKQAGLLLPVPNPLAIATAQSGVGRTQVEQIVREAGGDVWGTQFQIQQAASSADQPGARSLVREDPIALAERTRYVAAAALGELAQYFPGDGRKRSLASSPTRALVRPRRGSRSMANWPTLPPAPSAT